MTQTFWHFFLFYGPDGISHLSLLIWCQICSPFTCFRNDKTIRCLTCHPSLIIYLLFARQGGIRVLFLITEIDIDHCSSRNRPAIERNKMYTSLTSKNASLVMCQKVHCDRMLVVLCFCVHLHYIFCSNFVSVSCLPVCCNLNIETFFSNYTNVMKEGLCTDLQIPCDNLHITLDASKKTNPQKKRKKNQAFSAHNNRS
jgi:hypothetical protein